MAFRSTQAAVKQYPTPEALFVDIKQKKSPGLLSHQADIIRSYMAGAQDKPDVSIQLATGAGKTLIGVLIGEWLRRERKQRVVYLCPNKQLASQVSIQAKDQYGIDTAYFSGSKSGYAQSLKDEYTSASKLAVTSYSSLFNVSPFFDDPQIIILDDVHQAEGFINSLWSVRLLRDNERHTELYESTISLIKEALPQTDFDRIIRRGSDLPTIEKLPMTDFDLLIPRLSALFDTEIGATDQVFSWRMICRNLHACHFYFSQSEILIKPLYPPTFTFKPFNDARQRIYMSATLGNSGDLERIVGRKHIFQIPVPSDWSDRAVGRRFFYFPEVSLNDEDTLAITKSIISKVERTAYLTPSNRRMAVVEEKLSELLDFTIFKAGDIETGSEAFSGSEKAILLLANRYDGIDFPNDECRMLIIDGLPKALNLQEGFQIEKLGMSALYQSRIVTRVTQAFGRTTRNPSDYSAVVVVGDEIVSYLQKSDNRQFLLPELRAEIEFGLEQSRSLSIEDALENIELFLLQGEEWKLVEGQIQQLRDSSARKHLPNADLFLSIAKDEIDYSEAMWMSNFSEALDKCKIILGKSISSEMRGLRGFWNYLAGVSTYFLRKQGATVSILPEEYFSDAAKAAVAVSWLHRIKNRTNDDSGEKIDVPTLALVERLESQFVKAGKKNAFNIEKAIGLSLDLIGRDDSTSFENGQVQLGKILGFDSGKIKEDGSPDPWWKISDDLCIVFEDYTEGRTSSELCITKARQAASHHDWVMANLKMNKDAITLVFLVGKITKVHDGAMVYLDDVAFWNTDDFRAWSKESLSVIRDLWSTFPESGNLFWRQSAVDIISKSSFSTIKLINRFHENKCKDKLVQYCRAGEA